MTTSTLAGSASDTGASRRHRVSFIGAVRGELLKLVTVRAVLFTLLAAVPLGVFFSFIGRGNLVAGADTGANLDALTQIQGSFLLFANLIIGVASVLSIASEYSTGQIGVTLTTLPRRWHVVSAKIVALGGTVWTIGFVTTLVSGLLLLDAAAPLPSNALGSVVLTSVGAGFAWAAGAIIALSIGGLTRSAAFGIAASFVLFFIAPMMLSYPATEALRRLTPNYGATEVITSQFTDSTLHGALLLSGWVLVSVVSWGLVLRRRDI